MTSVVVFSYQMRLNISTGETVTFGICFDLFGMLPG